MKMKNVRRISSKIQIVWTMMIFVIPLIILLGVYNIYNVHTLNRRTAEIGENIIGLYENSMERDLQDVENYLANFLANDSDSLRLRYSVDRLKMHVLGVNIVDKFRMAIEPKRMLAGLFFYSAENDLHRVVYKRSYSYDQKEEMKRFFVESVQKNPNIVKQGWFFMQVGDRPLLLRVLGNNGIYSMCAVDLQYLEVPQSISEKAEGSFLFFVGETAGKALPVTEVERIAQDSIAIRITDEDYYISGVGERYFLVQNPMRMSDLHMVYAAPYSGMLMNMDGVQLAIMLGSWVILLLIGFSYYFLSRFYLRPLNALVRTMEQVLSGKLDAKAEVEYRTDEFFRLSDTFNQMMDEIRDLKIDSYEQHIEIQQAQLQYLQIQIRPHFFLNCLKNLYAMIQEEKYTQTQEMILALSTHLRYLFSNNRMLTPLQLEIKNAENYILLQQMSSSQPPKCVFEIDQRLEKLELLPLSLLTFVENAVKYGGVPGRQLEIQVKISLLENGEESYVRLAVQDNGSGFSPAAMALLRGENPAGETMHIGVQNVCRRFRLVYGEKCSFLFSNKKGAAGNLGAKIEIFFPYKL